jgi:Na+-driven multidrug efflux pump
MAVSAPTSTPFIDWSLLGQIILISIVAGVGLVVAFSLGLAALSMARDQERANWVRRFGVALTGLMGVVIIVALLWGLELIVKKS